MHDFAYPSYLRTYRKRWALTQPELGALLGISASRISKLERLSERPSVVTIIGAEFVFGVHARRLFPALYASIETMIARRAALLAETILGLGGETTAVKRQLLEEIASRIASEKPHV